MTAPHPPNEFHYDHGCRCLKCRQIASLRRKWEMAKMTPEKKAAYRERQKASHKKARAKNWERFNDVRKAWEAEKERRREEKLRLWGIDEPPLSGKDQRVHDGFLMLGDDDR